MLLFCLPGYLILTDAMASVCQCPDYALFDGMVVVQPVMEVPVSVCWLPEYFSSQCLGLIVSDHLHIQEGKFVVCLDLHCESYVWSSAVQVD